MNKAKRAVQLTGAIISICIGALSIVGYVYLICVFAQLSGTASTIPDFDASFMGIYYVAFVLGILFSIALIICGSLMCPNPDKKNTQYKGLNITMLVLNSILLLLSLSSLTEATSIITVILCLGTVGLFIAALCIKDTPAEQPANTQVEQGNAPAQDNVSKTGNEKIDAIRKLHEDGVISEEEMKSLIMKELEK